MGPLRPDARLHHTCRNRVCRELRHLELVKDQGTHMRLHAADRTHCGKGHPWDEANTRRKVGGGRECRACQRESQRLQRARRKAAA